MANLKFFRSATAPTAAEIGAIWFDSASKVLKVKNDTDWEIYDGGRNVVDATFAENKLTITKADTTKVELDFTDVASAKTTMAVFKKLNDSISAAQTKAEEGVTNAATAQAAAEAAQTSADSKVASVAGDTTVKASTKDHAVTLSLATSDKGNVKFTQDADGLSANVTIPAATVTGVAADDKVLSLTDKLVSATVGLSYGEANDADMKADGKKTIKLLGKDSAVISEIDASDFIKDGMVDSVSFDPSSEDKYLTITFNTASGKDAIKVSLKSLVDTYTNGTNLTLKNNVFDVDTTKIATITKAGELATAAETAAKTYADELKEAVDAYTVNGKAISGNPVLAGSDIKVGGEGDHKEDTLDAAVDDIYTKIAQAASGGVLSFGGQAGEITLAKASTDNGSVNLKMTGKELSAEIVGLGDAAYKAASAFDAAGSASAVKGDKAKDTAASETVYGAIALANSKMSSSQVDDKISAAAANYATVAQGEKADSALQSVSAEGDSYVSASFADKASNSQKLTVATTVQAVSSASSTAKGLAEASDVKNYVDNHVATALAWAVFE